MGPCKGQRHHGDEQMQFFGLGEPGVLHVEAAGLGVAEQTFDLPALPVNGKGGFRFAIGSHDDHGAVVAASGDERHRVGICSAHAGEASLVVGQLAARLLAFCQGGKRGFATIIEDDSEVFLDPYGKRDVVSQQELEPAIADELAVGKQGVDRACAENIQIACHQFLAISGAAATRRKHAPQEGDAHPARGNAQDQKVDVLRTNLPVGPVEAQREWRAQVQKSDQGAGKPCFVKPYELEETLQATVIGGKTRGAGELACDVAQVHRAAVHQPQDDDHHGFKAAVAQSQMTR